MSFLIFMISLIVPVMDALEGQMLDFGPASLPASPVVLVPEVTMDDGSGRVKDNCYLAQTLRSPSCTR